MERHVVGPLNDGTKDVCREEINVDIVEGLIDGFWDGTGLDGTMDGVMEGTKLSQDDDGDVVGFGEGTI